eukprot:g679.t1
MADNVIVVENNNHLFRNKIRFDGKDENRHILEENMQAVCSAQTNQTLANLTYCLLIGMIRTVPTKVRGSVRLIDNHFEDIEVVEAEHLDPLRAVDRPAREVGAEDYPNDVYLEAHKTIEFIENFNLNAILIKKKEQ